VAPSYCHTLFNPFRDEVFDVTTPDQATLEQQLATLIQDNVLQSAGELAPDSDLFDAGLDSMAIMQLLLLIEDHFGVMPPDADVTRDNFATPRDLARLLHQRLSEQE